MRRFTAIILAGLIALCATGCTSAAATDSQAPESPAAEPAPATEGTPAPEQAEAPATAGDTVSITHSMGTAEVPRNPAKSVVFDMGILDTMDALGVETELAIPADSLTSYLEKYATATNAGGIKEPNTEVIFEFAPDVIFISGRQADYYEELNKIAPTVYVDLETATYMDDFAKNVTSIGEIYSKQAEAAEKLAAIQAVVEAGRETAAASDAKALIILTNDGSISAYGRGSRFGIIHDVLGIKTVDDSIDISTHGQEASYEYIAEKNPDILYVVDRTAVVGGTQMASTTLENDLVKSTAAAQNSKIIYLDAEVWYLAGGGITAVEKMVNEALAALA